MTIIRLRRGTAAAWTSANPILAAGEPGVELDTGYEKIGDGTHHWTALPYTKGTGSGGSPITEQDDPPSGPTVGDLWIDTNDPGPSGASGLPLADPAGVIDTTTYDNPVGSGKMAVAVFPGDTAAFAVAIEGDAFPRILFASSPVDGIYFGDGAHDPYNDTASCSISTTAQGDMDLHVGRKVVVRANSGNPLAMLDLAGVVLKANLINATVVAAATPGTVIGKVDLVDANGDSVGWLPVYDAIT